MSDAYFDAPPSSGGSGGGVKAASGTSTLAAGATVTLATVTRSAGQIFAPAGFITNNVAGLQLVLSSTAASGADGVCLYTVATAVVNQLSLVAVNLNQSSARTLDWALLQS